MMLTGQNCVLHPGPLRHPCEPACVPLLRIKCLRGRVVFVNRNALRMRQRPDAPNQRPRQLEPALAAMAPMDKHPESSLVEPRFHRRAFLPSQDALVHPVAVRVTLFGPLKISSTGEGHGFENDLLPFSPRTLGTTPRPQALIGRGHAIRSGSDQSDQSKTARVYHRAGGFG